MDMYASDMIYMIFKNIQDEFETSRGKNVQPVKGAGDAHAIAQPAPRVKDGEPRVSNARTYVWLGTAAAVIGAGVAAYVLSDTPPAKTKNFEVK
jgi:hypothetical protein